MAKKVFVGMSGGVDSSVTAALLKERGFDVTGVYMKNWSQDLPGHHCPWKEDYQDAKRVAVRLGIPFKMYDFEREYHRFVVDYMIDEYKAGRTPNPDIMCNQEVKFKLFLKAALADGADMIATGHYARIVRPSDNKAGVPQGAPPQKQWQVELHMGVDQNKDQSYFLCRVSQQALQKSLMPIGEFTKAEVRELARKHGLVTAEKKDSQGICFVGKIGIKEFLQQYVTTEPGQIIDQTGTVVGEHDGALFYTIGQRHGLQVGGGLPFYVVGKNMEKNEVHVTTDLQDKRLWNQQFCIANPHWVNGQPQAKHDYCVRTRYRAECIPAQSITKQPDGNWQIKLRDEVRALTPGQSAAIYQGTRLAGSGIVV